MERRYAALGCGIAIILTILVAGSITSTLPATSSDVLNAQGMVCLYKDSITEGQNTFLGCSPNTVTNIGKNHTRSLLAGFNNSYTNYTWQYLQLSVDTTAANATVATCSDPVTGNGLDITLGGVADNTERIANFSISKKFEATGTQAGIAKVCLHNGSATTGELMASSLLSATVSLVANENLTIWYYVAIS